MEKFNRLEIRPGYAVVGSGVLLRDVHAAASSQKQFYPPDPTETAAAIGGTIATNASGARSFRYGDTRRHVLALRAAFLDGSVKEFRRGQAIDFDVPEIGLPRTTKHSAGYRLAPGMDWVDLFIGSEGTLGVISEAELKLLPAPGDLLAGVIFFRSENVTLDAVDQFRTIPGLRMLEFFDGSSLVLLRSRYPEVPAEAAAALLIEQEPDRPLDEEAGGWLDRLTATDAMVEASWFAATAPDRERFRRFRHALPELVNDTVRRNGFMKMGSDFAVPVDQNRAMLAYYRSALDRDFPGQSVVFGHIGDAHVHANILPRTTAEFDRAANLMLDFARYAVSLGGTVGAEHGLGKRKAHLLEIQYDEAEIEAMRKVKRRFDPQWLLGRGTLFGPSSATGA